jgi:single-stranded DNA-binding protein
MADINKVWVSGLVVTQPILTKLASKTPFTTFTLQVNETFLDRFGSRQTKSNLLKIESLGKSAEQTAQKVKQGARFSVDGYLRQDVIDGADTTRIRSFAIYPDDSSEVINYKEGLRQALEVLRKSRDMRSAVTLLEELLRT